MMKTIHDDHQCKLRRRFETKRNAQAAALSIFCRTNKQRIPEPCSYCNGWHLADPK